MDLDQLAFCIMDFLPKSPGAFNGIHFFHIASAPTRPSSDINPVSSAAPG